MHGPQDLMRPRILKFFWISGLNKAVDEDVVGAGLAPELAQPTGHQRREGRFAPGALGAARELHPIVIVTLPPRRWLGGAACRGRV